MPLPIAPKWHVVEISTTLFWDPVLRMGTQQLEDDVDKATSLMALYDIRMKLKEQDNTSLNKLREKIAALQTRQQAEKKEGGSSRYTYPKAPA